MAQRIVLVTGGATGIGRAIAHRFAGEGAHVVVAGRTAATGAAIEREIVANGGRCSFQQLDLAQEPAVRGLIETIEQRHGRLDVVINNAGVGARRSPVAAGDPPGTRWDKLRGPNLDAPYFVCAHALQLLAETGGSIVNLSSTAAAHGNWGLYGIAKAGVEGLTRAFAAEGGPLGVRVNGVSPGWIATELDAEAPASGTEEAGWQDPPSLLGRVGTPQEIAATTAFLASPAAAFITGQTLVVDGGLTITDYPSRAMLRERAERIASGGGPPPGEGHNPD